MKVPVYEQQVNTRVGDVPTPKFTQAPASAFGIDEANAKAKAGAEVQQIAEKFGNQMVAHMQQQNRWKNQQVAYDAASRYRKDAQNILWGQGTKTVKGSDGNDYEIPDGLMNRKLTQAEMDGGVTIEFDRRIGELKQKYLDSIQDPYARDLFTRTTFVPTTSWRDSVIKHQVKQTNDSQVATFQSSLTNQVSDASSAASALDLNLKITGPGGINETNALLANFRGEDPETAAKNRDIWAERAVDKATTATLQGTGDLTKAMDLLNGVKDTISVDSYDKISRKLAAGADTISRQALKLKQDTEINTSLKLIEGFTTGKIGWQDADIIEKAPISEPMKMAFRSALMDKSIKPNRKVDDSVAEKDSDIPFAAHIASVINKNDNAGMLQSMERAMHGYGSGKISQDKLNIIAKLVIQRSKNLQNSMRDPSSEKDLQETPGEARQQPEFTNPVQDPIDAGLKSLMDWNTKNNIHDDDVYKNYIDSIDGGKDPKTAYDDAIRSSIVKRYPKAVSMQSVPNFVIGRTTKSKFIFQNSTEDEPQRVYNPATKKLEANPKFKAPEKSEQKKDAKSS